MSSDTFGRNVRPLFMRTYGRTKAVRKVDAWLSPDYRKNAFSSTDVSDPSIAEANDSSVKLKKRYATFVFLVLIATHNCSTQQH